MSGPTPGGEEPTLSINATFPLFAGVLCRLKGVADGKLLVADDAALFTATVDFGLLLFFTILDITYNFIVFYYFQFSDCSFCTIVLLFS